VIHMKRVTCLFLLLASLLGLTACGFQLSGYQPLPESARHVSLILTSDTPANLERALKTSLRKQGVLITADAPYTLAIRNVQQNRRSITIDSNANVDEYEMLMQVTFEVMNRDQQSVSGELSAFTEKILDYDSDKETASATLQRTIKREMWQTLADRIVRQYIARAQ
jgi:LPS-assembly lipoprotein